MRILVRKSLYFVMTAGFIITSCFGWGGRSLSPLLTEKFSIQVPINNRAINRRRFILGLMILGGCYPNPSNATLPTDAGEAIRRSAANIPGYGQTDVFFPASLAGSWKMTRDVEFAGREQPLRLTYPFRFIRSIEDDAVVADRGTNQAELEKASIRAVRGKNKDNSDGLSALSYEWVPTNPNDLRLVLPDGSKKEIKVTKRATERTDNTVFSSEFQRVTQEDERGIPVISARRVVTKWKVVDDATLEGLEIVYSLAGGDPLSVYGVSPNQTVLSKSRMYLNH